MNTNENKNNLFNSLEEPSSPEERVSMRAKAHRLARRIGLVASTPEQQQADRDRSIAELHTKQKKQFEQARDASLGANLQALMIREKVGELQDASHVGDGKNAPIAPTELIYGNKKVARWVSHLRPYARTENGLYGVGITGDLGSLHLDSPDRSDNGLHIHADTVKIISETDLENSDAGAVSTSVIINERPSNPTYHLAKDAEFTGGVKIDIDAAGNVIGVGMTRSNAESYVPEPVAPQNLPQFMDGLMQTVEDNTVMYRSVSDQLL